MKKLRPLLSIGFAGANNSRHPGLLVQFRFALNQDCSHENARKTNDQLPVVKIKTPGLIFRYSTNIHFLPFFFSGTF